jgi:hypothetical protein
MAKLTKKDREKLRIATILAKTCFEAMNNAKQLDIFKEFDIAMQVFIDRQEEIENAKKGDKNG